MERSEAMKEALDIVKSQASVRAMNEDEIVAMVAKVTNGILDLEIGLLVAMADELTAGIPAMDPKKSIRETSVTCLECGKKFKVLTKKHLATHGLTPDEYRAKYGFKKGQPLACKSLARERRKKMTDMKLWEKRQKPETPVQQ